MEQMETSFFSPYCTGNKMCWWGNRENSTGRVGQTDGKCHSAKMSQWQQVFFRSTPRLKLPPAPSDGRWCKSLSYPHSRLVWLFLFVTSLPCWCHGGIVWFNPLSLISQLLGFVICRIRSYVVHFKGHMSGRSVLLPVLWKSQTLFLNALIFPHIT